MQEDGSQRATMQSFVSRLCSSILMAVCVAPIVLTVCCIGLGWNEKREVCEKRAIVQGEDEVVEVGCNSGSSTGSGDLIMFSCDLKANDLPQLTAGGDFNNSVVEKVVGLRTVSEMLQCVETVTSRTENNSVGGGTTRVNIYTYSVKWESSSVDDSGFRTNTQSWQDNCNSSNPLWPSGMPLSSTQWVPSAQVGDFTVTSSFLSRSDVALDTELEGRSTAGWTQTSNRTTYTRSGSGQNGIGRAKVSFFGNDWRSPATTVLGLNSGGTIGTWTADDTWMCSGFSLGTLKKGVVSKEKLFAELRATASSLTWVLRFVFLCIMWAGFCCFFKPLEVVADAIPYVGPCLGKSIFAITACISCPMTCACGMGVIGFMWVFMRPLVGIPLMIGCCLITAATFAFKEYAARQKKSGGGDSAPDLEAAPAESGSGGAPDAEAAPVESGGDGAPELEAAAAES